MLVQLPQGSRADQAANTLSAQNHENNSFEAALRRDLASIHVVAYEPTIGGIGKRGADLVIAALTAPAWGLAILIAVLWVKLRTPHASANVVVRDERIGYGGRPFQRWRLSTRPRTAEIVALRPEADAQGQAAEASPPNARTGWREVVDRMPEMLNVLRGDMSLIGPRPIPRQEFEDLRSAQKYYASARPGFIRASDCDAAEDAPGLRHKHYAMHWSPALDLHLAMEAYRRFTAR